MSSTSDFRAPRFVLMTALLTASLSVHAAGPAPSGTAKARGEHPHANKVDEAPRYQSDPPADADERAADALNQRDEAKQKARSANGDRTVDKAGRVTLEADSEAGNPASQP